MSNLAATLRRISALFAREVAEHRSIPLFCLALGLLPLLLTQLPIASQDPEGTAQMTSLFFASLFLGLGALAIGSSVLCRDWAEDRIGFYLARPFRPWELWSAKLGAVVAVLVGGTFLVLLPTLLLGALPWEALAADLEVSRSAGRLRSSSLWSASGSWFDLGPGYGWGRSFRDLPSPWYLWQLTLPLGVLALVGIGHVLGVLWRLRGWWTAVDLGLGVVVVALLGSAWTRSADHGGFSLAIHGSLAFLLAALAFLALVGWVQIRFGGRLAMRAHAVFTLTAALLLGGSALAFELVSRQIPGIEPGDMRELQHYRADESGTWLFLGGQAPPSRTEVAFAVHRATGDWLRLGAPDHLVETPVASADGTRLAWLAREPGTGMEVRLHAVDLRGSLHAVGAEQEPRKLETEPTLFGQGLGGQWIPSRFRNLALDAAGERLALASREAVVLLSFDDGRLLDRWQIEDSTWARAVYFSSDGALVTVQTRYVRDPDAPTDRSMPQRAETRLVELHPEGSSVVRCRIEGHLDQLDVSLGLMQVRSRDDRLLLIDTDCRPRLVVTRNPSHARYVFFDQTRLLAQVAEGRRPAEIYRLDFPSARDIDELEAATGATPAPVERTFGQQATLLTRLDGGVSFGRRTGTSSILVGFREAPHLHGDAHADPSAGARGARAEVPVRVVGELDVSSGQIGRRYPGFVPWPGRPSMRGDLLSHSDGNPAWLLGQDDRPYSWSVDGGPPELVPGILP